MKIIVKHSYSAVIVEVTSLCDTTRNNAHGPTSLGWIDSSLNLINFEFNIEKHRSEGYPAVISEFLQEHLDKLLHVIDEYNWMLLKCTIVGCFKFISDFLEVKESEYTIIQEEFNDDIQEFLDYNIYPVNKYKLIIK